MKRLHSDVPQAAEHGFSTRREIADEERLGASRFLVD